MAVSGIRSLGGIRAEVWRCGGGRVRCFFTRIGLGVTMSVRLGFGTWVAETAMKGQQPLPWPTRVLEIDWSRSEGLCKQEKREARARLDFLLMP